MDPLPIRSGETKASLTFSEPSQAMRLGGLDWIRYPAEYRNKHKRYAEFIQPIINHAWSPKNHDLSFVDESFDWSHRELPKDISQFVGNREDLAETVKRSKGTTLAAISAHGQCRILRKNSAELKHFYANMSFLHFSKRIHKGRS